MPTYLFLITGRKTCMRKVQNNKHNKRKKKERKEKRKKRCLKSISL